MSRPEPHRPASSASLRRAGCETAEETAPRVVVGILADPDLPARLADDLGQTLPAALERRIARGEWQTEVLCDPFEAMHPDYDHVLDKAGRHVRNTQWDLALCLTDLPVRDGGDVVVAMVDTRHRVALISLPALGGLRLRHRLRELALAAVAALRPRPSRPREEDVERALRAGMSSRGPRLVPGDEDVVRLVRSRTTGVPRLLAGMVRANRPWQLFIGLSTALAGALAGTAFGILYSSIWQLATALGPLRLAGVTVAALVVLAVWIITGHGLWERAEPTARDPGLPLRNAGTVATVAVGTGVFFAALLLLTLAGVALVIPPDYLGAVLGRSVGIGDYVTIALMASVLGTVAGAVGSGLEDDTTVRKAAYGYREQERRRRAEADRRRVEWDQRV